VTDVEEKYTEQHTTRKIQE